MLEEMEGGLVSGAPVNGRLLKHYFLEENSILLSLYISFYSNIACVDGSLIDLKHEAKEVSSPRDAVIWFLFLSKFYSCRHQSRV